LQRILGRGGCGFVILAYDKKLGRDVAVKFLERNTEIERQRLRREGRALAEMDHPNVVRILDVGEFGKTEEANSVG
jgi:serine/threonine-protein kinase